MESKTKRTFYFDFENGSVMVRHEGADTMHDLADAVEQVTGEPYNANYVAHRLIADTVMRKGIDVCVDDSFKAFGVESKAPAVPQHQAPTQEERAAAQAFFGGSLVKLRKTLKGMTEDAITARWEKAKKSAEFNNALVVIQNADKALSELTVEDNPFADD